MTTATQPVNYWPQNATAKAFWGQQELPAYKELLADTVAWLEPQAGQRWLDLGCGGGQLTRSLWQASQGAVAEIIGMDCAAANEEAYAKHRTRLQPTPGDRIRFIAADFSHGLPFDDGEFNGVVSGLAIQYAEDYSPERGWTDAGYDRLLAEVFRVLTPGGRFVFSVNIPNPSWAKVALHSTMGAFLSAHPVQYLQRSFGMWSYGGWLKREARKGRFHYLHRTVITAKLAAAGFRDIECRRSFARQAYILRGFKPA